MKMNPARIILTFSRYTDAALFTKAEVIYGCMNKNPNFLTPNPSLDTVQAATKAFGDSLTAAAEGSRTIIAVKNKNRKALEVLLRQLGGYVIMIAGEDRAILISSGFDLYKDKESSPVVTAPLIEVSAGVNPGEALVQISSVKGSQNYGYEYTPDPVTDTSVWRHEPDTRISHLFTNLPSGKRYAFRAAANGLRDVRAYSSVVYLYIQ